MLSSHYDDWINQLLAGPVPEESKATCDDCAMLPEPGAPTARTFFHPRTKCCTYEPTLVNYRAGLILSDDDPSLTAGRRTVEERLRSRIGATPWGIRASRQFRLLYTNSSGTFGRAPDLGCPHQIEGRCGIWRHRPATCTTWFCKHVRGATGFEFWNDLAALLREVDTQIGLWCALEMGASPGPLARLLEEPAQPDAGDLGGDFNEDAYRNLWGKWAGLETQFYCGCAERVRSLRWSDVVQICGPRLAILSRLVRERYEKLMSEALPEHPRIGLIQIEGTMSGKFSTVAYSPYDPVMLSPTLAAALVHFDGRPTLEVLEELRVQRGLRLDPSLVRRMVDFRVLVDAPRLEEVVSIFNRAAMG